MMPCCAMLFFRFSLPGLCAPYAFAAADSADAYFRRHTLSLPPYFDTPPRDTLFSPPHIAIISPDAAIIFA
jgi:hypothetical protein